MSDSTQRLLDSIAYVAWHGQKLQLREPGRALVVQPDRADLHNYVGTTHAGAIYTLAETAAGVAADSVAATMGGFVLLAAAELRHTRRAQGTPEAEARLESTADVEALAREYVDSGRGRLSVGVHVRDAGGEAVFDGTFHYAIRKRTR